MRRPPLKPTTRFRVVLCKSNVFPEVCGSTLNYLTLGQEGRLSSLVVHPFVPCKCFHPPTLDQLNIVSKVEQLFSAIGWERYLVIDYPSYEEFCYEFYVTFEFEKSDFLALDTPGVVKYRLWGTHKHILLMSST